jgi:hypothetical protein
MQEWDLPLRKAAFAAFDLSKNKGVDLRDFIRAFAL